MRLLKLTKIFSDGPEFSTIDNARNSDDLLPPVIRKPCLVIKADVDSQHLRK